MFGGFKPSPVRISWRCSVCGYVVEKFGDGKKPEHCNTPMTPILVTAGKIKGVGGESNLVIAN